MQNFVDARKEILFHYSPYSFLPGLNRELILKHCVLDVLATSSSSPSTTIVDIIVDGHQHLFFMKYLEWDSRYFNLETYKLLFVLFDHQDYSVLRKAIASFIDKFRSLKGEVYCFSEIPSEDIFLIQALNESGFKLVETRLTYYVDLRSYSYHSRYGVREATLEDLPNLTKTAGEMRNEFDRFHAETLIDRAKADQFLETYVEQSVKGFADYTMVPGEEGVPPDAFLTANYLKDEWGAIGEKISKMVLSAVSSSTCKGWYLKLISEMAYHLRGIGADFAFMNTATPTRAVIHTYEKLGCKYGKTTHIITRLI